MTVIESRVTEIERRLNMPPRGLSVCSVPPRSECGRLDAVDYQAEDGAFL